MELKFQSFLKYSIEAFPAWVLDNNLDPSLSNPKEYEFTEYPKHCNWDITLKDEKVFGLSKPSKDHRVIWSYVNMEHGIMLIAYDIIVPISFKGIYSAKGLVDFKLPLIVSEGKWSYTQFNLIIKRTIKTYRLK